MTVTSALKAYQTSRAEEAMIERLIDLAKIEVAKKRGILVETNRELKVVTQLKEKAFTSYTIESHREQQNALDEIAGYRAFSI
jgi:flagellar export protein FliJ